MSEPGSMRVRGSIRSRLRCPACGGELKTDSSWIGCVNSTCARRYPIVDERPVLIDEDRSLFRIRQFTEGETTYFATESRFRRAAKRAIPSLGVNLASRRLYARLRERLIAAEGRPVVLVLGGGEAGFGFEALLHPRFDIVKTDVAATSETEIICDAHSIPFETGSVDAVVAQAVLEHVADPQRCVSEIRRVLRPGGFVYAEIPFMQQVHGGRYDFTRFTHLGVLRLFRGFTEIESGAVAGAATALVWAWQYFLLTLFRSRAGRELARVIARLTGFWLKYFDHVLIDRPGSLDAASGFYFLGERSEHSRPDEEIIGEYRGAF